ncbi:MAG TPA: hypothetical protein VF942_18160 [Acidimicrobiales bacterium]
MFQHRCVDCFAPVVFVTRPGEATCFGCGLRVYLNESDHIGAYPPEGWRPGPAVSYTARTG